MITAKSLIEAMPNVPRNKASVYAHYLNQAMLEGNITTVKRADAFLAQVAHESDDLVFMEEIASGEEYEGRRDLGNTHPGDGRRYKGRGPIQLTGRSNYLAAGRALGVDLVDFPERAADPKYAFRIAVWFWTTHGLNRLADHGDFRGITQRINGGLNGYDDRLRRWHHIRALRHHRSHRDWLPGTLRQRIRRRLGR